MFYVKFFKEMCEVTLVKKVFKSIRLINCTISRTSWTRTGDYIGDIAKMHSFQYRIFQCSVAINYFYDCTVTCMYASALFRQS